MSKRPTKTIHTPDGLPEDATLRDLLDALLDGRLVVTTSDETPVTWESLARTGLWSAWVAFTLLCLGSLAASLG